MSAPTDATALAAAVTSATNWIEDLAADGPDVRVTAPIKLLEEAAELAAAPDDIEEAADVAIVLVAMCLRAEWSMADLAAAMEAKTAKNLGRTWEMTDNGAWHHVKTIPRPSVAGGVPHLTPHT